MTYTEEQLILKRIEKLEKHIEEQAEILERLDKVKEFIEEDVEIEEENN